MIVWTPWRVKTLREMHMAGHDDDAIAAELGTTARSCHCKRQRMGIVRSIHPGLSRFSTGELVEALRHHGYTVTLGKVAS